MNILTILKSTLTNESVKTDETSVIARQMETLRALGQRAKMGQTAVIAPIIAVKLHQLYEQH